jgi:hypothetical protein
VVKDGAITGKRRQESKHLESQWEVMQILKREGMNWGTEQACGR